MENNFQELNSDRRSLPNLAVMTLIFSIIIFLAYVVKDIYESGLQSGKLAGLFKLSNYFNSQNREEEEFKKAIVEQEQADAEFIIFEIKVAKKFPWRKKLP